MATTVTFQQGASSYTGFQDVWLTSAGDGNANEGGHSSLLVGYESGYGFARILMRWNLTSIPYNAQIVSATLQLYDTDYVNRNRNSPINIYQPSAANAGWVVGSTTDNSEVGAVCWNKKTFDTVAWAGSAGMSTPTTDYINTSLAAYTFVDGASGFKTITFNATGLAYIQSLFGTTGGAGILIVGDEVNSNCLNILKSSDHVDGSDRPILTITYAQSGMNMIGLLS